MQLDIVFRGLKAPLRLVGAEAVGALLPKVAPGWPHEVRAADPAARPFFTIRARPDSPLFDCESHVEPAPPRQLDPVNAVCDAMAALAQAWPAEDARLICLHAAGVEMAGRLVVFPNVRRAGKSTLSAALARAGHRVFSDDVLPLSFSDGLAARGLAMGVAPRLRLPLPPVLPGPFRAWAEATSGPANAQYKYLTLPGQPGQGEALPVGAFVILDRQEGAGPARLDPVSPDAAMDALLHQNFTRDRHSADILEAMAACLAARPVFRLAYSGLGPAVASLEAAFSRWADPAPAVAAAARLFRMADLDRDATAGTKGPLVQRRGTLARMIGETLYLADAEGRAIHRMDPLAAAIWDLLEAPVTPQEIETLVAEAFPGTDRTRIAADLDRLLDDFAANGLIEAADPA